MRSILLAAVITVLSMPGRCFAGEPTEVDPDLNGRWLAVSAEGAGVKKTREQLTAMKAAFVFDNGRLATERDGETLIGTYTTDQTKNPQQLDLILDVNGHRHPLQAIYKIEADTLVLCHPKGATPRPGEKRPEPRPEAFEKTDTFLISTYEREAK